MCKVCAVVFVSMVVVLGKNIYSITLHSTVKKMYVVKKRADTKVFQENTVIQVHKALCKLKAAKLSL